MLRLRKFSSLISCSELHSMLEAKTPVYIVDSLMNLPTEPPTDQLKAHYDVRIPSSRPFDVDETSDHSTDLPHMLQSEASFISLMKSLRIKNDGSLIVCYDKYGAFVSPRVWYTFKCFQRENVKVLDGGLPEWQRLNLPTESGPYEAFLDISTESDEDYIYKMDSSKIKTYDYVSTISHMLSSAKPQTFTSLVDARSPARFIGAASEPRPGIRSGNIPGSLNLFFQKLFNEDKTFKSPEELRSLFVDAGVSLDNSDLTVFTCGSGVTACVPLFAMDLLGKTNYAVYDGSWSEYAMKTEPIHSEFSVKGTAYEMYQEEIKKKGLK